MAGVESGELLLLQVSKGSLELGPLSTEMEPADDIKYPVLPRDFFGILHRVAYPRMCSPRYDDKPITAAVGKRGIIDQLILLHAPVRHHNAPWSGQDLFK